MRRKFAITIPYALTLFSVGAWAQQASITLKNSDVAYCYKQDANWTLTKTNDSGYPTPVASASTVNWTVTATRGANGPKQLCAIGYVSVTNTGTAPATIGNIVVDLQRNTGKWNAISADVADATNGDAATSDKIVAAALQNQTVYTGVATTSGVQATFTENSASGKLSFTDADNNTIWAITPQQTIAVGATVNLFFNAVFNVDSISPAFTSGEQLRTEVFVTFGNAGARGGSGSSASNIDINGNGTIGPDEANVRTVPTRITTALPALQICNDSVTITDSFSTGDATVSLSVNPIGSGVTSTSTQVYTLTGTVGGSGVLANTAELKGSGSTVTLTLGTDAITGLPITTTRDCCVAIDLTANSNVVVSGGGGEPPPPPLSACSYTQGAFNDKAKGDPATFLVANFSTYFPNPDGLLIGTKPNFYASWTDLTKLRQWLGGGGPSGAFTANTTNATSTSGGTLAKQTAALTINTTMGPAFPSPGIGNLILTGTGGTLDGSTVLQIRNAANTALGTGGLPNGYSFGDLNTLIDNLNQSWDNCTQSGWAVTHLQ